MAQDVFISYSSINKEKAQEIVNFLEANNISCFIAHRDIPKGTEFASVIPKAIEESKCFIALYSLHFNKSSEVERELKIAVDSKLKIIPYKLDKSDFADAKKYYLSNLNWIDHDDDKNLNQLLNNVKVVLELPVNKNDSVKELNLVPIWIAAGFLILFMAGFIHAHVIGTRSENLMLTAIQNIDTVNKHFIYIFHDKIYAYGTFEDSVQIFSNNNIIRKKLIGDDSSNPLEAKIGYVGIGILLSKVFHTKLSGKNAAFYYIGATIAIIGGYGFGYYIHEKFFPIRESSAMKKFLLNKENWRVATYQFILSGKYMDITN